VEGGHLRVYKRLKFTLVGSSGGKPTVFDDIVYFVACQSEEATRYVCSLLNSGEAKGYFSAYIFWDAKRPITVDLLRRLDLRALAREKGSEAIFPRFQGKRPRPRQEQRGLFDASRARLMHCWRPPWW
jgi:hypothetical protein